VSAGMARAPHTVAAAREAICASRRPLPAERVTLEAALGRTLAEPVVATRPQPPTRLSAMDGYALRRASLAHSAGLEVVGASAAGRPYAGALGAQQAVRIFTGAPVPEEADCVVPQERAQRIEERVLIEAAYAATVTAGANIRAAGVDYGTGAALIGAGTRLHARHLALIASSGLDAVEVHRVPRVALVATGDEIRAPGTPAGPYDMFDSVTPGLAGLIREWGGAPQPALRAGDTEAALAEAVRTASAGADVLVIAGGASVGEHDLSRRVLGTLGLELGIERIAVRPGKPTWFGTWNEQPVLGLPGNPAAAFVCAQLFLRPLLGALLGRASAPPSLTARLEGSVPASGETELYLRALLRTTPDAWLMVTPDPRQDTSLVSVYARANALIRRVAAAPAVSAGTLVEVLPLEQ